MTKDELYTQLKKDLLILPEKIVTKNEAVKLLLTCQTPNEARYIRNCLKNNRLVQMSKIRQLRLVRLMKNFRKI